MKVSLSWLKEYLDLKFSVEKISDALTLAGLETEGIEELKDDVIFEIGLTPNLGHCMSIIGIARELSAILNIPLNRKEFLVQEIQDKTSDHIGIKIEDSQACHRYSCRLVKNIQVGPSPEWLQKKLESVGLRSINNVVDVGNLVMFECGQPLHLFDYDQIQGKQIKVKTSSTANLRTLDGLERQIPEGILLICDAKRPIAVAGLMGEQTSAVSEKTTNVLIEGALFTPQAVRKSSKLLSLRTDSSVRFERGIDPLAIDAALDMAAALLYEIAEGDICRGIVSQIAKKYEPRILDLNPTRANHLLGINLSVREICTLLGRLEIEILQDSPELIKVQIPSYRNDLNIEVDLIEEVGRIYGFNHIPRGHPRHVSSTLTHAPLFLFEEEFRRKLMEQGLQECLTCDLISPKLAELTAEKALDRDHQIHVLHPASVDQSVLRASLLPGLLQVIKFNLDRQNLSVAAFEVGHIHFKEGDTPIGEPSASIILTGKNAPYHFETKPQDVDFFDLKGYVENLLSAIGIHEHVFEPSHLQNFHPGRQARIKVDDIGLGVLGEVLPSHLQSLGIDQRVYYAEINIQNVMDLKKKQQRTKALSLYPGSQRDLTITLPEKMSIGNIIRVLKTLPSPILEDVFLLDLYKSEKIGKDKKNATFRFQYRDQNKTLEYEEVEREHQRLREILETSLMGKL